MARAAWIKEWGGLAVGLALSPFDGGISAARAAPGALSVLIGDKSALAAAQQRILAATTADLAAIPDFTEADRVQAMALLRMSDLTGDEIVAHRAKPEALHDAVMARLAIGGEAGGERLFSLCLARFLDALCNDQGVLAAIEAKLVRDMAQDVGEIIHRIKHATDAELHRVAAAFHIEDVADYSASGLRKLLEMKAQDYHRLRAEIEAIDERVAGLGNVKAAAKDAIARLDFPEVERLLARVSEVETEIAAESKSLRGQNALLMGDARKAYDCFTAAAAAFGDVDRQEMLARRNRYANTLYEHGLRYGGAALGWAVQMWRDNLALLNARRDAQNWAVTQNNLGAALASQGIRTAGGEGAALLGEAVAAYCAALRVYTEAETPLDWAMTQNNLGAALGDQGSRTAGAEGTAQLGEAVAAFRAALRVYTEAETPLDWAMTQNNLGAALANQGSRTAGAKGAALLGEAVAAYRAALRVYTDAETPLNWAGTQNNIGNALANLGSRTAGAEGAALLGEAVAASRAALRVYTEAEAPLTWAGAQNNIGNALRNQGSRTAGAEGAALLGEAVAAYRAALRVRSEAETPFDWAQTQENLAIAELALAVHDTTPDPLPHLRAALTHVEAALRVYDPDHTNFYHDKATRLRALILDLLTPLQNS